MSNFSEEFDTNRSKMNELQAQRDENQKKIDLVDERMDVLYGNSENLTENEELELKNLQKQRTELSQKDLSLEEEILLCLKKEMELINS